jgi:hypothetical protein
MSRQSKQRKKAILAVQFSSQRKSGSKGPSATESVHGKRKTWCKTGRKVTQHSNRSE